MQPPDTNAPFWHAIDWRRPWLAPYRANGERACAMLDQGSPVHDAFNELAAASGIALQGRPLMFVPHDELPAHDAYESFIFRSARVPTRGNLHDFFNALVWLAFPQVKRRLNELQAEAIKHSGVGAMRGPLRDALTLFDENAALWWADAPLADALAVRDWKTLFITQRGDWHGTRLVLFGHALLEKLVAPRKPITAHVWRLPLGSTFDELVSKELDADRLVKRPWLPMPILGVPGWWLPNEDRAFYDDATVFRQPAQP